MSRSVARLRTPDHVSITPQRLNLQFDAATPRYWFDNDPVVTHFLNAMSLSFPDGERFFVDSVRHFRDRVEDPKRQKDISGFIGQEAMHSLEHTTFNRFLDSKGYGRITRAAEKTARHLLKGAYIRFTSHEKLAATAALEHITAILADALLRDEKTMASIHPGHVPCGCGMPSRKPSTRRWPSTCTRTSTAATASASSCWWPARCSITDCP